ncbi:MAG: cobalamin-independent methionine synthase II family protein [Tardiphaga sp.]
MTKPIFRADHCGSLIRPEKLRRARLDRLHGRIDDAALAAVEDAAILDVLKMQRDAGIEIYSDGEFRRAFWLSAISDKFFHGFENRGIDYARYPTLAGKDVVDREEFVPQVPVVVDKLQKKGRITGDEIKFMKKHSPGTFKMTLPSPVTLVPTQYRAGISDRAYPAWQDFFEDFTRLMADEVKAIADDGVTYIQVDAPGYSRFIVPERLKEQVLDKGLDPTKELDTVLAAENTLLRAAKRDGVTVAVHICLGTYILGAPGPLGGAGSTYEAPTVGRIIDALEADTFLIEYSERSSALDSLRDVPKNKIISLGLINIRDPQVETVDGLRQKLDTAAKFVPMENLSICPNCGFSGAGADAWISEDIQRRKLDVLVETARRTWG